MLGCELHDGDRVIMVEDATTYGKSLEETNPELNSAGDVDVNSLTLSFISVG